jgi:hypothetical protein
MKKILFFILFIIIFVYYKHNSDFITFNPANIEITYDNKFFFEKNIKNIGLFGCTPSIKKYLEKSKDKIEAIKNIKLSYFLDIETLENSLRNLFLYCKSKEIDCLIFSFLPVKYKDLKDTLKDNFIYGLKIFFGKIQNELKELMAKIIKEKSINNLKIIISFPCDKYLKDIFESDNFNKSGISDLKIKEIYYACHTIKIKNIEKNDYKKIIIFSISKNFFINLELLSYFKYKYLKYPKFKFEEFYIGQDYFYKYID